MKKEVHNILFILNKEITTITNQQNYNLFELFFYFRYKFSFFFFNKDLSTKQFKNVK